MPKIVEAEATRDLRALLSHGAREIRPDAPQETEIDKLTDELRGKYGGKFSFSACIRYLLDLRIRTHRAGRRGVAPGAGASPDSSGAATSISFPLRADFLVPVSLPRDLTVAEAKRLGAFLLTLAADFKAE